ncbi:MAG: hypothetical protein RSA79_03250 [Oscillospiraceae bacterium]
MIIDFKQTGRQPNPTFEAQIKGVTVARGMGLSNNSTDSLLFINNKTYLIPDEGLSGVTLSGAKTSQITQVYCNDQPVGRIYPDIVPLKKFLFIQVGYDFFSIELYNRHLIAYNVGLGREKHFICFYENDILVAMIHKIDLTINFKDNYVIYAQDETLYEYLCVFNLYFDSHTSADCSEYGEYSAVESNLLTIQEELTSKYDPDFIPRIKALDGVE